MDKSEKPKFRLGHIENDGSPVLAILFVMIFSLWIGVTMGIMVMQAHFAWEHRKCKHVKSGCVTVQDVETRGKTDG